MSNSCGCGCGQDPGVWEATDRSQGRIKGEPKRFLLNHDKRLLKGERNVHYKPDKWDEVEGPLDTPCHVWKLAKVRGYPVEGVSGEKRIVKVHVRRWTDKHGPIPEGKELHHRCLNKDCVNPDHCEPLTRAEHAAEHKRLRAEAAQTQSDTERPIMEIEYTEFSREKYLRDKLMEVERAHYMMSNYDLDDKALRNLDGGYRQTPEELEQLIVKYREELARVQEEVPEDSD